MNQLKIMVVDDEPFIRDLMEEFLTIHGYEVIMAGSGEEAVSILRENVPDMVLLDIWMPGMTGLETLGSLKKMNTSAGVVMLSAFGDEETVTEAIKSGADFYLQKPIEFKKLLSILQNWKSFDGRDESKHEIGRIQTR